MNKVCLLLKRFTLIRPRASRGMPYASSVVRSSSQISSSTLAEGTRRATKSGCGSSTMATASSTSSPNVERVSAESEAIQIELIFTGWRACGELSVSEPKTRCGKDPKKAPKKAQNQNEVAGATVAVDVLLLGLRERRRRGRNHLERLCERVLAPDTPPPDAMLT
eukprot:Amastigsp_a841972_24.p3 type:complete len:165 gc:universal Amastigsp_a841972_24:627-133(-)